MRIGQLARKFEIPQEKIIQFLDDSNPEFGPYHNNSKLSDAAEELIANHFKVLGSESEQDVEIDGGAPDMENAEPKEEIIELKEEIVEQPSEDIEAQLQAELDPDLPSLEEPKIKEVEVKPEVKAIDTDRLIELIESEDEDVDLSDITLIKAPKKELEGLKVVGKIDLPEPKPKKVVEEESDSETSEAETKSRPKRAQRRVLSDEEREQRRLQAKKKKEAYDARQERRKKEEAERLKKELKKAHYEQKIEKVKAKKSKPKTKSPATEVIDEPVVEVVQSKSRIGRLWRWFWVGEKL